MVSYLRDEEFLLITKQTATWLWTFYLVTSYCNVPDDATIASLIPPKGSRHGAGHEGGPERPRWVFCVDLSDHCVCACT